MVDRHHTAVRLIGLAAVLLAGAAHAATPSPELARALENLRNSNRELIREEENFRAARQAGKAGGAELEDHAGFVAGLRVRHLEQCETVRALGGNEALKGFDCVLTGPAPEVRAGAARTEDARTETEKRESLDSRLSALETEIDEKLLRRQQEIRENASNRSANGGGGGGGGGGASGGGEGDKGEGAKGGNTASGSWSDPDAGNASAAGRKERQAGRPPSSPEGKVQPGGGAKRERAGDGGSDDDIVARQLREAAEKETDPVLKEKLWAEYRKYKEAKK